MQSTRPFLFVLIASLKCEHRDGENPPIYSGARRLKQRVERRKIRLIEGNAKCRHLKKFTCKGTAGGVYLPRTPYPTPPLTHCINVYRILIDRERGEGGRGESTRRKEEGQQCAKL
jgi:hypothetical protein